MIHKVKFRLLAVAVALVLAAILWTFVLNVRLDRGVQINLTEDQQIRFKLLREKERLTIEKYEEIRIL